MRSVSQERSDSIISPYPLVIPDRDELFKTLKNIPKSRIVFITIRDPKQKYTMNKSINWIKKHTDVLCIVRGLEGGEHYHLIAGLKADDNWTPRCSKGIHFNIQYVNKKNIQPFDMDDLEDLRRSQYYAEVINNSLIIKYEIPFPCVKISKMIKHYFRLKNARDKALVARTEKQTQICNIINYLEKNLSENSDIEQYITYYYYKNRL